MSRSVPAERDVAEVAEEVDSGAVVCASGNGSFPRRFVEALARRTNVHDVTLNHPMRVYDFDEATDYAGPKRSGAITHVSDFTWDAAIRAGIREGRATFRPNQPHDAAKAWRYAYPVDYYVTQASAPDRHGYVSLGVFGGWSKTFIEHGQPGKLVLEVNARQPRILGGVSIHVSEAYAHYSVDYGLPQALLSAEPTALEERIAENVVDLIPDEATLQIGVGVLPDLIVKKLIEAGKRHLGIHTENLSDTLVDLIETGIVDNSRKAVNRGVTVCTLSLGTDRVYDFLNDNPGVVMLPVDYVNDPSVIASNPRQVSVNATLAVDLSGQCASETIGPLHYSGTGGQWEFLYGASRSEGGRGIVTLPSTAKNGTLSTIVSVLPAGAAVTVPRNDAPTIVTEYGVADLRGKTLRDRATSLIAIAHPQYRERLSHEAAKLGLLG
jgi:acyl-CoA hydrolase